MNLVEVELQDYRQFLGVHTFAPAQQAMIGIIGENGAGKTTLFEAIEWCLYNPSGIRNDDIRPRAHGGRPRVKITLEHPRSGEIYEIERELKGRSVSAAIYRVSQPETPIVQGTKQVTDFVTKTLLGLHYQAFVATFFTRQKELSFFGALGATDRRREVGKLLGLETIRLAQQSIGQQRQEKLAEARQRKQIYEDQSSDRDFASDRSAAQALIDQRATQVEAGAGQLEAVAERLAIARDRLRQADTRANQHNSLRLEETAQKGSYERSLAEIEAIKAQIAELDAATLQVDSLTPLAESASTLQERLQEHERARKQSDAIAEAGRQLETLEKTAGQIRLSIHDVKSRISEERAPLQIEEPGSVDVLSEIANLLTIALSRDTDGLQAQLSALERCIGLSTAAANEQKRLTSYLERAGHIETELREILANGDPAKDVETAVTAAGEARKAESAARARLAEDEKQRARLESLSARLASGQFDEPCPTCGRPYDPAAIEQDLLALRVQIETLSENIQRGISEAEEAATKAVLAEQQEASARKRLQQLAHCKSRLEQSGPHIEEAREACALASSALSAALHATGRDTVPSGDDIDAVRAELLTAQRQQQEVPLLEALRRDYQLNAGQIEAARAHRINLGADTYDRSAHAADTEAWRSASDASAQIAVLLQRIASRQAVQDRLSAAETRSRSIAGEIEKTQEAIRLLAFSPEEHAAARDAEQAEREHYERLLHEQHELKSLLTAAENALIGIDAEETRLKALLQSSIDAQVAADELDRMYREFSRFEQYVARAVTPALAEITSQLVSAVTEGKYDRVEFSEDFGIEVFDGDDDHFPLSQFSGGERDVIALCARLALSQFLGGQSGSPPQFVVMDEVFGSLDKTRRENLMDTLNRLVDDSGAFRQLFVISHVDDVRASTAFDEVWRVEEGPDGSSQLEQLSSGSVPVDL